MTLLHLITVCLVALAILVAGVAAVWWWGRRKTTVRYVIVNIEDGWRCDRLGETPEEAWELFGGGKAPRGIHAFREQIGFRCARVRVTEIGGE